MLGKKNVFSKKSKRHISSSVISVLMSLILASTPIYADEMEMEEYIDYDDSYDSYDYSYEDYSYDDSSSEDYSDDYSDNSSDDSSNDDSSSDNSSNESSSEDGQSENTDESNSDHQESETSETETTETNADGNETDTQKNNAESEKSSVDESENTAGQESVNNEMNMTTNDKTGTADGTNGDTTGNDGYVESTMDVQYEKGGQAAVTDTQTQGNTNTNSNFIELTGEPITDIITIFTAEFNEIKEAFIQAVEMVVKTDTSDTGNMQSESSETPSNSDTTNESDTQIDLTNQEPDIVEEFVKTDDASEEFAAPTEFEEKSNEDDVNKDGSNEEKDASENELTEQNTENTADENTDEQQEIDLENESDKQEENAEPSDPVNQDEKKEDGELTEDNQIDLDPGDENGEQKDETENDVNTDEQDKDKPSDENTKPKDSQIVTEEHSDRTPTTDNTTNTTETTEKTVTDEIKEEEQQIIDLIGDEQQIINLTGDESAEVVELVKAIEESQEPDSEVELVTNMVVDVIDLAEEIGTSNTSSYSYSSSSGGGYSSYPTIYNNMFNPQPHQQTREEWMNSLTPYERMLTGMTKTEERPATVSSDVNIYSGRGITNTVVGVLPTGGVCYILEDGEWAYIESGEVRGFIRADELSEGNIANNINVMPRAESTIDPNFNDAFNYLNITTSQIPEMPSNTEKKGVNLDNSISRNDVIAYAMQTDTMMNTSAGFVKDIYSHFGISLPDSTNDQSYVGDRVDIENVRPGDLVFYKDNGTITDVLICIGDDKVIRMNESGKHVEEIDFSKVCWATRLIPGATQASEFLEIGQKAAAGDETARNDIISALADASEDEWNTYGFPRSVLIAEAIMESNWLSFGDASNGGMQPQDNNIMNMNEHLRNDEWESPWSGDMIQRNIPRYENGEVVYGNEMMRAYNDIESCFNDYAAFKTDQHPNLEGETDIDIIIEEGLQGYATDPDYQAAIKRIIEQYELTQFDNLVITGAGNYTDSTNYTQDQLELIWAITAQEDDTSYEGALAVISTAMNRADQNYGGHGVDALSQLTADGQFCYSPSVSDPIYYQRRLNGNVPEYVKQAVYDCLEKGVRNHQYLNFRSSNRTGNYTQIGGNWFF